MEYYHLRTFVAVAEEEHLTRAAERLNASLPAVSAHIRSLEDELGVALFARTPRGMRLTAEGRALLGEARSALSSVEAVRQRAGALRQEVAGVVRIGLNNEAARMRVAGNLHDLGKLAVSREILDKPGPPDEREWSVIKSHPGHSRQVLSAMAGLEDVCQWASSHHERMDGKGYPDGVSGQDIPLGARVVATADVFTAITEDRPYRAGMDEAQTRKTMAGCAGTALDSALVDLLLDNMDELNDIRIAAQREAIEEFDQVYLPETEEACTART